MSVPFSFSGDHFYFKIYLFERERESRVLENMSGAWGMGRGRGRNRLPVEQGAQYGTGSQDSGIMT